MAHTILIAEDDPYIVKLYKLNLEQEGWNVVITTDGGEALKAIEAQKPDVLLLDLLMPKLDGYAVLEHIHEKGYDLPVIVLSNVSESIDQQKCKELGVSDYLTKSNIDLEELVAMVRKYLTA